MTESASPASSAGRGSPVPSAVVAIEAVEVPSPTRQAPTMTTATAVPRSAPVAPGPRG